MAESINGKTIYEKKFTEFQERTALSVLIGLRQKFAMQMNDKEQVNYTPKELHGMITFLLNQVKKRKINEVDLAYAINPPKPIDDEVWGIVNKAVNKTLNQRYNWALILGQNSSLTKEILLLYNQGKTVNEAFEILRNNPRIKRFLAEHPYEQERIYQVMEISVHARYGENNTAKKMREEQ